MEGQTSLFGGDVGVSNEPQSKPTTVRCGKRTAQVNLQKKKREAITEFKKLLKELEGKNIYIGHDMGSAGHFLLNWLKLEKVQVETFGSIFDSNNIPTAFKLWGRKDACILIETDQVVALRRQEYEGYWCYLLDFWNGFGENPINPYRHKGYDCLSITVFK
jgi:hypothetical protein